MSAASSRSGLPARRLRSRVTRCLQHAQGSLATLCRMYRTQGGIFTTPGDAYTTPVEMWVKAFGECRSAEVFFSRPLSHRHVFRSRPPFGFRRESTPLVPLDDETSHATTLSLSATLSRVSPSGALLAPSKYSEISSGAVITITY